MSDSYDLKALIAELDKLKKDYDENYDQPISETMFMGLVPSPSKGSGLSKFRNNLLDKLVKSKNPLAVSKELRNFTGSVVGELDDNRENLKGWLNYIDKYKTPEDEEFLEWRGLSGKNLKDISKKLSDANKAYAVLDTAYGNNEVLDDLRWEAETTDKGGVGSVLKRLPSYILSSLLGGAVGAVGGVAIDAPNNFKSLDGIKYGAGGGAALGILLNYIRRKNKYGGAVNV